MHAHRPIIAQVESHGIALTAAKDLYRRGDNVPGEGRLYTVVSAEQKLP